MRPDLSYRWSRLYRRPKPGRGAHGISLSYGILTTPGDFVVEVLLDLLDKCFLRNSPKDEPNFTLFLKGVNVKSITLSYEEILQISEVCDCFRL
ncbi:hypothetical protein EVAR_26060_1 [Eumeta japonica]|uniref:Uncharacterized protein n=1 Tax=Eumeta variegata TaxID=151549 RepID=A0A4C1VS12_EUMVA|nr:hypothetical protein EVAR_26060_1 [Eumeta japonica]